MLEFIEITEISKLKNNERTYDLEVGGESGDHSYNIDGIIVHNSACTTRLKTGVGRPQLSAILECADAAHGVGGLICADGGCTCPGDIAKAFGAGADFVMLGGMLAGTDEAAGEMVNKNGKSFKEFYGMSSRRAQDKHFGGMKCYRTSEGREKLIPYTGPVKDVIEDILGGIRSTMTYIGARKLKDIPKCTTFYTVNRQLNTVFEKMDNL